MTPQIFTTKTLLDKSLKFRSLYYLSCVASLLGYSLRMPQYMRYLDRINPFKPNVSFLYPLKHQKTKGFPTFSGGKKLFAANFENKYSKDTSANAKSSSSLTL